MFLHKPLHLLYYSVYGAAKVASATASATCALALQPSYPAPSLAPGYNAQLIARNLTKPRGLIVDSDGQLLVVQQQVGITRLRIQDHDGCVSVSKRTNLVENANLTHGITLSGDGKTLYASSAEAVFSWPYDGASSILSGSGRNIIAITGTSDGDHITRTLLFASRQKNTLIVSRGSESNVDMASLDLSTGHCQIKSFAVQNISDIAQNFNTTGKLLGWGLRNSVGVAEHPLTGGIYSVEMGMDYATRDGKDISQNNPGDEMNYHGIIGKVNDLNQGLNHGYPYCHAAWDLGSIPNRGDLVVGNQLLVGDVNNTFAANETINDAVCARERAAPVVTLPPHNAPIDLKFTANGTEAYISFHGSWSDRSPPQLHCAIQANAIPACLGIGMALQVTKSPKLTSNTDSPKRLRPARLR